MTKSAPRREMFPKEFLIDLNATKAAVRCGYSKKTAYSQGARLLKNVDIQKAIRAGMEKRQKKLEITADTWLRELWLIGHSDLRDYITIDEGGMIVAKTFEEMPENASRALESIEENRTIKESSDGQESNIINSKIKFKTHSKLGALELIGKHLGFLKNDKIDIPGVEKALYELSEKFMPALRAEAKTRSDDSK